MAELDVKKAVLNYRNRFLREIVFDLVVRFGKDEIMRILSDIKIEDERNKPMSDIEVAFLKAWRGEDYIIGEKLPEYIELPKDEFSRILSEANKQLENYLIDQRNIIEQFHKLLGVYTSTTALAKIAVLMREEEDLQYDIYSTILIFCWKHYWDTFENDKSIIVDHIENIIKLVKDDIQKRRGVLAINAGVDTTLCKHGKGHCQCDNPRCYNYCD